MFGQFIIKRNKTLMKIAILGGGFTGLTAAYYLTKKNHQITVFEKEEVLGGMAAGFKANNWNWNLEHTYHHFFANDCDILNFAKEIGFEKIFFKTPITASLFKNMTIYPLDSPIDLLCFPLLSLPEKLRAGIVIAFLKLSPFLPIYEKKTAEEFLKKTMGEKVWDVLWQQLFRKKYGDYAGIILASFIWARIKKRTKKLGYPEGGFQTFINYLEKQLINSRINVLKNYEIKEIKKRGEKYEVVGHPERSEGSLANARRSETSSEILRPPIRRTQSDYDIVISTLPTPILAKVAQPVLPKNYLDQLSKIKYLHALTLILETDKPILDKTYWLNISTPNIPIMGIVQHTNYIDKKNYGNKHIAYIGWYLMKEDKLMKMEKDELVKFVYPYLRKINSNCSIVSLLNCYMFKTLFAQPIFDKEFVKNKPNFITPVKNFFIANLDMTYPYDRGTNYAVKLGKEVSKFI